MNSYSTNLSSESNSDNDDGIQQFGKRSFSTSSNNEEFYDIGQNKKNKFDPSNMIMKPDHDSNVQYSSAAAKMMSKMGWDKSKGLGKYGQGRKEIVKESKQRGRHGLGHQIKYFEPSEDNWNFDDDPVTSMEDFAWIPSFSKPPDLEEMKSWIRFGKKKLEIDDETQFCAEDLVPKLLKQKTIFDEAEDREMLRARTRSNPYELIKGVIFQNRAAMKMANMDARFDFMFTEPKDENGSLLIKDDELLYFADVCAGPGGFTEYVLWRKKWNCKGFGFTLKGNNDFKLHDFYAASSEYFEPHYGVGGLDGDGDVYSKRNQDEFSRFVKENTDGKGVHFMMADGGFSVEGQENIQEILSKRLYLCQFLVALKILREGGNFVCKLFDLFTSFSVGLVYLMSKIFENVCIFKPVTSRPANSERYIVCKNMVNPAEVLSYFEYINSKLGEFEDSDEDVVEIVPIDIMETDFLDYVMKSNNELGSQQIRALFKIQFFMKNTTIEDNRQSDLRTKCLEYWKVPNKPRINQFKSHDPKEAFKRLVKNTDIVSIHPTIINQESLKVKLDNIYDFYCSVSGGDGGTHFLLSLGGSRVYQLNEKGMWNQTNGIEIPANSLLEVEFITAFKGEGPGQKRKPFIDVVDVLLLNGDDVSELSFMDRMKKLQKYLKAIYRPSRTKLMQLHLKMTFELNNINELHFEDQFKMLKLKGMGQHPRLSCKVDEDFYFAAKGLHFLKVIRDPWIKVFSRSSRRFYYFNTKTNTSSFEALEDTFATYRTSLEKRLYWLWEDAHTISYDKDPMKYLKEFVIHLKNKKENS